MNQVGKWSLRMNKWLFSSSTIMMNHWITNFLIFCLSNGLDSGGGVSISMSKFEIGLRKLSFLGGEETLYKYVMELENLIFLNTIYGFLASQSLQRLSRDCVTFSLWVFKGSYLYTDIKKVLQFYNNYSNISIYYTLIIFTIL
jgi:hypothetical protein